MRGQSCFTWKGKLEIYTRGFFLSIKRVFHFLGGEMKLIFLGCLLGGVYVPCIYRMPGRVIVGNLGLCCCMPVQCVMSVV